MQQESPIVEDLLKAICRDDAVPDPSGCDVVVLRALEFICQQTGWPLAVGSVAEHVAISRRTLERRFRGALDCTIREAITAAQLWRAKRLLTETSQTVRDVAIAAGFSYEDRLCKVFSRVEGMTPTEYRRKSSKAAPRRRLDR